RLVVGLRAAVDEVALVQVARCPLSQSVGQGYPFFGQKNRRDAADLLGLLLDGVNHTAIVVPQVAIEDLGEHVEVTLALSVEEIDAVAVINFEEAVFALLNGPGDEQMLARRG